MGNKTTADNAELTQALRDFESQALGYAYRFINDAKVRSEYIERIKEFSKSTMEAYSSGKLTAQQAQGVAHDMRNQIMNMSRSKTSEIGKAIAVILKDEGLTLDALLAKYAKDKFGKAPSQLTTAERDVVALEIVAASGRSNPKVNATMGRLGAAGRAFWVLTALIAIYNVGTAENKTVAAGRELAGIGGGIGGGMAGGAAVGAVVTGPAAPIGAAIGAIIGGILGAIVADEAYVEGVVPVTGIVARIVPRFTHLFSRDEEGLANALYDECGINIDQVCEVIRHLLEYYNSDSDDVVHLYVQLVKKHNGSVQEALKLHPTAKQLMIDTLESGWTDSAERASIQFLQGL
ncbi:MAG: hypothetical protein HY820_05715 [Acidobacteria bacterium]|nr:hypothetical protein [Acidobacteriota bacterium]